MIFSYDIQSAQQTPLNGSLGTKGPLLHPSVFIK